MCCIEITYSVGTTDGLIVSATFARLAVFAIFTLAVTFSPIPFLYRRHNRNCKYYRMSLLKFGIIIKNKKSQKRTILFKKETVTHSPFIPQTGWHCSSQLHTISGSQAAHRLALKPFIFFWAHLRIHKCFVELMENIVKIQNAENFTWWNKDWDKFRRLFLRFFLNKEM